jgi:hypothetical protein
VRRWRIIATATRVAVGDPLGPSLHVHADGGEPWERDAQEPAVVGRLDALGLDGVGEAELYTEGALPDLGALVSAIDGAKFHRALTLHHEPVREERHLGPVLVDAGHLHHDEEGVRGLARVHGRAPGGG